MKRSKPLETCEHCRLRVEDKCRKGPIAFTSTLHMIGEYPTVRWIVINPDGREEFHYSAGCFQGEEK